MIRLIVRGKPKSLGSGSKKRWQAKIRQEAPPLAQPIAGPCRLRIDFFYDGTTDLDADNIIKPIQDALEGIVYDDDKAVVDVCARKINLQQPLLPRLVDPPPVLAAELRAPQGEFVFIQVAEARTPLEFL